MKSPNNSIRKQRKLKNKFMLKERRKTKFKHNFCKKLKIMKQNKKK